MKLHKKLIIVAAAVVVVGGAGTGVALAMQPNEQPKQEQKQASIEQPKAVEPKTEVVEEMVEEQKPAAVAPEQRQSEAPVEPRETLQQEAERRTRDRATKYGLNPDKQWQCMNGEMAAFAETHNEAQIREIVDGLLAERMTESRGLMLVYFDHNCTRVAGGGFRPAN